jgi:hypothetical protein
MLLVGPDIAVRLGPGKVDIVTVSRIVEPSASVV